MLRTAIVRVGLPLAWRLDPSRPARALARFAAVEADSAWQYLRALEHAEQPATACALFDDFCEELEHAEIFSALSAEAGDIPSQPHPQERKALVTTADELAPFLAYAFEAERSVHEAFASYEVASRGHRTVSRAFKCVAADEHEHEARAWKHLVSTVRSEQHARGLLRQARRRRWLDSWKRQGESFGAFMAVLQLGAIFLIFAPLLGPFCRRRVSERARAQVSAEL